MLEQILFMFSNIFSSVLGIITSMFNAVPGLSALVIAFFFMFMAVKFFIRPFTGRSSTYEKDGEK